MTRPAITITADQWAAWEAEAAAPVEVSAEEWAAWESEANPAQPAGSTQEEAAAEAARQGQELPF